MIEEYGTKPILLRISKLFKVRQGYRLMYISKGCFKGMRELLV